PGRQLRRGPDRQAPSAALLAYTLKAGHPVPSPSSPGPGGIKQRDRPDSGRPVRAARAGVDRDPQVLADDVSGVGDARERAPDGLADRDPGPLPLVRERPGPPAEPGGAGELADEPGALRAGPPR